MKKLFLTALVAASAAVPFAAQAQDDTGVSAPRTIEPYVGVLAGREWFDSERNDAGIPQAGYRGWVVEGVAGVNANVTGPLVLGIEGQVAKGVEGDIDWQYGVAGRVGVRAGKDSMFYGKVGYRWNNFDALGDDSRDFDGMNYGAGVEVSTADLGSSAATSNLRLRVGAETFDDFNSIRPTVGVIAKF